MMKRREARILVTQALYQYSLGQEDLRELFSFSWFEESSDEKILDPEILEYASLLLRGVLDHLDELNTTVNTIKQEFKLYRLGEIDRAIILLSIYGLRYQKDLDAPVIFDEAIEVAKVLSDESSYKLINRALEYEARTLGLDVPERPLEGPRKFPKRKIKIKRMNPPGDKSPSQEELPS